MHRDIRYYRNNPDWRPSLGEAIDKAHYRNRHYHAVCDPATGACTEHYDKHDPHESIPSLVRHMWDSDLGRFVLVALGIITVVGTAAVALRK